MSTRKGRGNVTENGRSSGDQETAARAATSLDAREMRFVQQLAAGKTMPQASRAVGISDRTGRRWRSTPRVGAALREALQEQVGVCKAVLASGAARAARSLVKMSDGKGSTTQVAASKAVVDGAIKAVEIDELQAKVAELEAALSALTQDGVR